MDTRILNHEDGCAVCATTLHFPALLLAEMSAAHLASADGWALSVLALLLLFNHGLRGEWRV